MVSKYDGNDISKRMNTYPGKLLGQKALVGFGEPRRAIEAHGKILDCHQQGKGFIYKIKYDYPVHLRGEIQYVNGDYIVGIMAVVKASKMYPKYPGAMILGGSFISKRIELAIKVADFKRGFGYELDYLQSVLDNTGKMRRCSKWRLFIRWCFK